MQRISSMSAATRAASTQEQEEAIEKVEEWAERADYKLRYGTCIGKSPQTVIMDHKGNDGAVYIDCDGKIEIWSVEVNTYEEFLEQTKKGWQP
jgi:hypothetical protein